LQSDLVTGSGFVKENDLKKTLDELVKNAEAIDGVNKITLDELFNTGFILDYDADANIIAIEILEASTHVSLADLSTMNFEINRPVIFCIFCFSFTVNLL